MERAPTQVSLASLAEGAAGELFGRELAAALKNINDPNTSAKVKRTVTLTVVLQPGEDDRERVAFLVDVKSKLAPVKPHAGLMYLGEKDGQPVAVTFDPRQNDLFPDTRDPGVTPLPRTRETAS